MKAAPEDQLRLLDLQELDLSLGRLAHRRETLPELGELTLLSTRLDTVSDDIVRGETEDSDLGREQARVDADVEMVRGRMTRDQQRLDTGNVGSPRELENLASEVQSLHRRQAELEDAELEVMERREVIQMQLAKLREEQTELRTSIDDAEARRDSAYAEIDNESTQTAKQRTELADGLPADLTALYEKLRASSGGVGAAALHRGRCEGCHIQLNTTDVNRIRDAAPDEVLRCEECRRILVRTDESGL
ncbi:MAG TPA: C4-type zinc ribbon domain-containing protein [Mycobacteriales bacterium]|nr:C4-type zinc ribbon domain-containing protein [Mycobacteriales bacterium]